MRIEFVLMEQQPMSTTMELVVLATTTHATQQTIGMIPVMRDVLMIVMVNVYVIHV